MSRGYIISVRNKHRRRILGFYLVSKGQDLTSVRKSSMEAAENVGTKSAPFMTDVMNSLPESANSHVIQAAASNIKSRLCQKFRIGLQSRMIGCCCTQIN